MSDVPQGQPLAGQMPLFAEPELLSRERHAALGLSRAPLSFGFASRTRGIPLALNECIAAQKFYPLIFTRSEQPDLLAVVGVINDSNLFVGGDGHWEAGSYIPTYVRCHPFALARKESGETMVVIDRASALVSAQPDVPFFDGDELSDAVRSRVDTAGVFEAERQQTYEFCRQVSELGLLAPQDAKFGMGADQSETLIAEYAAVDLQKLDALESSDLIRLQRSGMLTLIHAHTFSMQNWQPLITRFQQRQAANTTETARA